MSGPQPQPSAEQPSGRSGAITERECDECHRVGSRGFVPSGDYGWRCSNERACADRAFRRR